MRDALRKIVLELPLTGKILKHPDVLKSLGTRLFGFGTSIGVIMVARECIKSISRGSFSWMVLLDAGGV